MVLTIITERDKKIIQVDATVSAGDVKTTVIMSFGWKMENNEINTSFFPNFLQNLLRSMRRLSVATKKTSSQGVQMEKENTMI